MRLSCGTSEFLQRRARQDVKAALGERRIAITARGVTVSGAVRGKIMPVLVFSLKNTTKDQRTSLPSEYGRLGLIAYT